MSGCSGPSKPSEQGTPGSLKPSRYCERVPTSQLGEPMEGVPPLPPGSVWLGVKPGAFGSSVGKVAVPKSIGSIQTYISTTWPSAGWTMGRGESERGLEIEQRANKGEIYVSLRGLTLYCDPEWSVVYLNVSDLAACREAGGDCSAG